MPRPFSALVRDLSCGARVFARQPGLWALAVLTLGLGIGVNSTIFTTLRSLLTRPLSILDERRTVMLLTSNSRQGRERVQVSIAEFADWRVESRNFEKLAAFGQTSLSLTSDGEPERVRAAMVSDGFFELVHAHMGLGRTFRPEETSPGRQRVAVISHGLWQRRFAGDAGIVGKTLRLDEGAYTVVGVAAPEVWFPSTRIQIWVPLVIRSTPESRRARAMTVMGLLKPQVRLVDAQQEMDAIARRQETAHPDTNAGWNVQVYRPYEGFIQPADRTATGLLYWLGAGVLLIACANVANLLLARSVARRKEMAIRQTLGAGRGRLLRQAVAEGLWLAVPSGLLGLLMAVWCGDVLMGAFPNAEVRLPADVVDMTVIGFTMAVAIGSVLLFSLAPAWQAAAFDVASALREAGARSGIGRRSRRLAQSFVILQTALALGLLFAAVLTVKGMIILHHVDPGFQTSNMVTIAASPASRRYQSNAQVLAFHDDLLRRVRGVTGIESAAAFSVVPVVSGDGNATTLAVEGRSERPSGNYLVVSPEAFETLRIPLRSGRSIRSSDTEGAPRVVVVNQTAANLFWPGEEAVGRHVRIDGLKGEWFTVAGVCRDVKRANLTLKPGPQLFVAVAQNPWREMTVVARSSLPPAGVLPALRAAAREVDREEPLQFSTIEEEMYRDLAGGRTVTAMLVTMGAVALFLAATGLFCLLSYQVGQQLHEIGIRVALGAKASDIIRHVSAQALRLIAIGTAFGLVFAYAAGRVLVSLLYDLKAADPVVLFGSAAMLALAAALACWAPARRALAVDPAIILRSE